LQSLSSTNWDTRDPHQDLFDTHPLKDIQGSGQILQCLKHLQTPLVVQRLWLIALHWAQLQSGFQKPILEDPNTPIPHLESQYIHSIRQFLQSINGSIHTDIPYTVPFQQVRDQSLMEIVVQSTLFLAQECKTINYCRQFLQVHTLSDLALAGGTQIEPSFLTLSPSLLSSRSTLLEPLQVKPLTASASAL
jgi:hypothetical protein